MAIHFQYAILLDSELCVDSLVWAFLDKSVHPLSKTAFDFSFYGLPTPPAPESDFLKKKLCKTLHSIGAALVGWPPGWCFKGLGSVSFRLQHQDVDVDGSWDLRFLC